MKEFESKRKLVMGDMIVLLIIELLRFIFIIVEEKINFIELGINLLFIAFFSIIFVLAKKGDKKAGIFGLIIGVLMMLTIIDSDFIDFLLGLFITLHSAKYFTLANEKSTN